jgi:hypothetical protein
MSCPLGRATIEEMNIGRSSETLNTATPVRAINDALRGENSSTSAWTDRNIHSSRPATMRRRIA